MTGIDITLDTDGWTAHGPGAWTNDRGEALMVDRFDLVPDLPADLDNADQLVARWPDGGNLGVSITLVDGLAAVSVLSKFRREPSGIVVLGALIIPRAAFSHVVRVQCPEVGTTGVREAIVLDRLMGESDQIAIRDGQLVGWQVGPEPEPPLLAQNLADREEWDEVFPEHCLSRCRRHLHHIEATARVGAETRGAAPFRLSS